MISNTMHVVNYLSTQNAKHILIARGNEPSYAEATICGHCDTFVKPFLLLNSISANGSPLYENILLCPNCHRAITQIDRDTFLPLPKYGKNIKGLPDDIQLAYEEARICISNGAFFACELLCRKLLMHISVDKGDKVGKKFVEYINYLEENGFITSSMKIWVDEIRNNGNSATHEIEESNQERAKLTFIFTATLLINIYEMIHELKNFKDSTK